MQSSQGRLPGSYLSRQALNSFQPCLLPWCTAFLRWRNDEPAESIAYFIINPTNDPARVLLPYDPRTCTYAQSLLNPDRNNHGFEGGRIYEQTLDCSFGSNNALSFTNRRGGRAKSEDDNRSDERREFHERCIFHPQRDGGDLGFRKVCWGGPEGHQPARYRR